MKDDWKLHEVLLTEALMKFHFDTCVRGYEVNRDIRPDATLVIGGKTWHVEMDTGLNTGYTEFLRRLKVYQKLADPVLWITTSATRLVGLKNRASSIKRVAWFTTVEKAGTVWINCEGVQRNPPTKRE